MFNTRNDLPKTTRVKVIDLLDARLADAIDLQTQLKQAHWNVKGPNFIALHELFDKINEAVEDYVDDLAERVVQLGGTGPRDGAAGRQALDPAGVSGRERRARPRRGGGDRAGRLRQAGARRRSTRPTSWATRTPPICSRRSRAEPTSGCGSSRRTSRRTGSRAPRRAGVARRQGMILGMSLATFTALHVVISLVGIAAGLIVVAGMLSASRLPGWTALFLVTTVLTSVTGFFFPAAQVLPSHIFGVVSLVVLGGHDPGALRQAAGGILALDLRGRRGLRALPELVRRGSSRRS